MKSSEFKYRKNPNKTITITGYNGSSTDVVIPSEIDGLTVTKIGVSAFSGCTGITSVTIPNSVIKLGNEVFYGCTGLTSVIIPDSVTKLGNEVFYGCSSLTSITIPSSIKSIENSIFSACIGLKSVTIPNSIITIGAYSFSDCSSLTRIAIPNSVKFIGKNAFENCIGLKTKRANYKAFKIVNNRIEYKGYTFSKGEWSTTVENMGVYEQGYHFCTNLFDIFGYCYGVLDKNIAIYECEVGGEVIKGGTSKCVTNKIKPVRRLSRIDIIKILNGLSE